MERLLAGPNRKCSYVHTFVGSGHRLRESAAVWQIDGGDPFTSGSVARTFADLYGRSVPAARVRSGYIAPTAPAAANVVRMLAEACPLAAAVPLAIDSGTNIDCQSWLLTRRLLLDIAPSALIHYHL